MGGRRLLQAARAGLSLPTAKRVEAGLGARVSDDPRNKLQRAPESTAVAFIDENGGGPGVRGYESGTRRRIRSDQATLSRSEAIRHLTEIALITKSKRQSNRGEK